MITAYALLLDRCGLSHREAAEIHGVRLDTVKSWAAGRNPAPAGVVGELRDLHASLAAAAQQHVDFINDSAADGVLIELGLAQTDDEARTLGLPCIGAQKALLGMVVAAVKRPFVVVPRGSTLASAAAVAAHRPKAWPALHRWRTSFT